jgi:hypothetical protein
MRCPATFAVCLLLASAHARAEILYARPDGDATNAAYRWGADLVTDAIPVTEAIKTAKEINGSRPLEIRLLHRAGAEETLYAIDIGTVQSALRWRGSERNKLVIRGQIDRSGAGLRRLTTLVGRSLRETLCEPEGFDICSPHPAPGEREARQDMADYLAGELERPNPVRSERAAAHDVRFRLHCFLLWESAFVEFVEMGFRDCWIAAVATYASAHIALRDSLVEGSTYAFAAFGRKGAPETAHSFELTGNIWRQSPASYRAAERCDIHVDWNCPVSVWSDVPWAITHHHFWNPLDGALFVAKDVLGNVRIAGNELHDAYNGIRAKPSSACFADADCRTRVNVGFEIVGNFFNNIRDNPIEPEGHAAYWIIKHNTFLNAYASISTDGVSGHDFLIFGNIFALDEAPGSRCRDEGWAGSRQFRLTRGGGRWSRDSAEGGDARCDTHAQGTVLKLGVADDDSPGASLLDRILFFNNSVRTRSPLFRGSPAPPIGSYNNAVIFTGCGRHGPLPCRQEPDPDPACDGRDIWTADAQALYAECFATTDRDGRPLPHVMRFNAYNRAPGPKIGELDRDRLAAQLAFVGPDAPGMPASPAIAKIFALDAEHALARRGCTLSYANRDLVCAEAGGPVGAMLPGGKRFDLDLPFRFPFVEVLQRGEAGAPPRQ